MVASPNKEERDRVTHEKEHHPWIRLCSKKDCGVCCSTNKRSDDHFWSHKRRTVRGYCEDCQTRYKGRVVFFSSTFVLTSWCTMSSSTRRFWLFPSDRERRGRKDHIKSVHVKDPDCVYQFEGCTTKIVKGSAKRKHHELECRFNPSSRTKDEERCMKSYMCTVRFVVHASLS